MVRRALLTIAIATTLVAAAGAPAGANNQWGSYHWETGSTRLTVSLVDRVTSAYDSMLGTVSGEWSSPSLDTSVQGGTATPNCGLTAGVVEVCNGDYGANGWLGLATIAYDSGSHIVAGKAQLNDYYFEVYYPSRGYTEAQITTGRRHVLCQEVGHTVGLDHRKRPHDRTCMNDSWGLFDPAYQSPDAHDIETLDAIHSHDDAAPPPSGGGDEGGGGPCHKKPDHPKCSAGARGGQTTVHTSTGPNGHTLVTFILWA